MTELARGTVGDRPWGRTLGALGARSLSGQLTVLAEGKPYRIAFRDGAVVGATSPLASDAAVRLALTGGLVTSTQVAEITRRIAAVPGRDEVDVLAEAIRLAPEPAVKLRRRLVAQRAARTFALEQGEFIIDDRVDVPVVPGSELDVRAVIYLGARANLTQDRLVAQVTALGAWFKLKPEVVAELVQFGFTDADKPVLQLLLAGANLDDLEAAAGGEVNVHGARAIVYALASCNACESEPKPRAAMPRRSHDVTPRASVESIAGRPPSVPPPTVSRTPPPPAVARTPTPSGPITARFTATTPPATARTPTPTSAPAPARTPTPTSAPAPARTSTPTSAPVTPRTTTPTAAPATPRTTTHPPRTPTAPPPSRTSTAPPAVGRVATRPPSPNDDFAPSSSDRTPSNPGIAARRTPTGPMTAATDRTRRNTSATKETESLIRDRVALLDRGADHFVLLGISRDASADVTRAAYFTLARKLHPDRLASLGIGDAARDAQRLFAQINAAFATLNDPAKRAEYGAILARGGESAVREEEAKADETVMRAMHAEEAFRRGEMALRRDQLAQALTEFTTAVELRPTEVEYHALLAWTKFAASGDKASIASETRSKLTRAAEQNEQSPTARFYLGRVERILGREQQALQHFQEVLRIKANHSEASAEIRVLESRLKKR